jgi:hypothetical protein
MLQEIKYVKQKRNQDRRRWFTDNDYWDVSIWVRDNGSYSGFRLGFGDQILTWMEGAEPTHSVTVVHEVPGIDPGFKGSELIASGGTFDPRRLAQHFWRESKDIDNEVRTYIIRKLKILMARARG